MRVVNLPGKLLIQAETISNDEKEACIFLKNSGYFSIICSNMIV